LHQKIKSYRFEKPKYSKHHRTPEGIRSKGLSKGAPAQVRESYDRCLGELVEEVLPPATPSPRASHCLVSGGLPDWVKTNIHDTRGNKDVSF
jgi:hypothetical protein